MPLATKKIPALATALLSFAAPMQSLAFVPLEGLSSHVLQGAQEVFQQAQHVAVPIVARLQETAAAVQSDPIASKVHDVVRHSAQNVHFNPASSKLLKSYGDLLVTHPLETKVGTAAVLASGKQTRSVRQHAK